MMTETDWMTYGDDPLPLLEYLQSIGKGSERRLRLFAVACCRLLFRRVQVHPWFERCVDVAERFADGVASSEELQRAYGYAPLDWLSQMSYEPGIQSNEEWRQAPRCAQNACWNAAELEGEIVMADCAALNAAWAATQPGTVMPDDNGVSAARLAAEQAVQCDLLRDIFCPFWDASVDPSWLAWNSRAIPKLARAIYEERLFSDLPILGDALEEAGCANATILTHSRSGGKHVRGCWLVDLILGLK